MSVSLMISNAVNIEEENLNIPISTEKVFQDNWIPIIEKLNLKWIRCFQSGIELEKEDIEAVLKELDTMQVWVYENMNTDRGKQMIVRIDNLSKALIKIFKETRNDIKVYIG